MTTLSVRPPLLRPRAALLGGVSAGLATHLRLPVVTVRVLLIGLVFAGGFGALFYLWLWALVPLDREPAAVPLRRSTPVAAVLVALAAVLLLAEALAVITARDAAATITLLGVVVTAGGAVAWNLTLDRADARRTTRYAVGIRLSSVALLIAAGTGVLVARPSAVNAVLGVLVVIVGVAVLVAPRVVTLWSDLLSERSARVREEQRAEIAAHLHDSVLQTLALIQNRAGASSEVARIARAQERELRDWLFADDAPVATDLATEIRAVAAAIELDHAVRIDVVTVGEPVPHASAAIVAATREAMLNAARHAGGEVSVYLETTQGAIDVFVRDRGPGVDLATLPDDRLGIRESIIGRMARAGGIATVRPGAGSGTEVHLHLEVSS